ncbi:hypothetical protein EVAR_103492_1 [Eumeta japonica]|uniref:Uncharacterized protein n=1 Tax=Eumeta variegata TaxID=151549 RepID=A0A4C1ZJN0_EUMVA|nr:hypothetical protein EVAR_103492_1 [Eumeta japonica]
MQTPTARYGAARADGGRRAARRALTPGVSSVTQTIIIIARRPLTGPPDVGLGQSQPTRPRPNLRRLFNKIKASVRLLFARFRAVSPENLWRISRCIRARSIYNF